MTTPHVRKLAAIMFTDMVGYSALMQRNEALGMELLEEHFRLLRGIFPKFEGAEIKTIGDSFLVEFPSIVQAANCAIETQKALFERNGVTEPERQIRLRIGLHVGDVIFQENDVFGDGVNIASRVEPLAEAGGISVTEDVHRQIRNKIALPMEELGPQQLKNIELPMTIYRIQLPWLTGSTENQAESRQASDHALPRANGFKRRREAEAASKPKPALDVKTNGKPAAEDRREAMRARVALPFSTRHGRVIAATAAAVALVVGGLFLWSGREATATADLEVLRAELSALAPISAKATHRHSLSVVPILGRGGCDGRLVMTDSSIRYIPDSNRDHALQAGLGQLTDLEARRDRLSLVLADGNKSDYEVEEATRFERIYEIATILSR